MAGDQDPTKLVVNGAALNFMTTLVDGLRRDMALTEERLTKRIDRAFAEHAEDHDIDRLDDLEWRKRTRDRLSDLEKAELDESQADVAAAAYQRGQRSWIALPTAFVERHHRALLLIVSGVAYIAGQLIGQVGHHP